MLSPPVDPLDEQLAAVFDTPPASAPASPAPKRTIFTSLFQRQETLTTHAAQLAAELTVLQNVSAPTRVPISHAMMQRRLSRHSLSAGESERREKERVRRARNAFKVVGKRVVEKGGKGFEYVDLKFVNMSLKEAVLDQMAVEALFEHFKRVDVAEIRAMDEEMRTGKLGEFVVFGCLVKKHAKKESKNGSMYAVWSVCNMPRGALANGTTVEPTLVTVLMFEEAFRAFHTKTEGSVFAFRKPALLPPRGGAGGPGEGVGERGRAAFSGHCLRVGKKEQVIYIGICKDFKLCEALGPNLSVCASWYDANRMGMCPKHALNKRKKMTGGRRMDVNNAERPGLADVSIRRNIEPPLNISLPPPRVGGYEGRAPLESLDEEAEWKKRKEASILRKLKRTRVKMGGGERIKAGLSEMVAKRKRMVQTAWKDETRVVVKDSKPVNAEETGKRNTGGGMQNASNSREKAIAVLLSCGYVLEKDGSMRPPGWRDSAERDRTGTGATEEGGECVTKSGLADEKSGAEACEPTEGHIGTLRANGRAGGLHEKPGVANIDKNHEAGENDSNSRGEAMSGSGMCVSEGDDKMLELSDESDESGEE